MRKPTMDTHHGLAHAAEVEPYAGEENDGRPCTVLLNADERTPSAPGDWFPPLYGRGHGLSPNLNGPFDQRASHALPPGSAGLPAMAERNSGPHSPVT